MSWKFWRRQEKKQAGGVYSVYLPGVGKIMGDRVHQYIKAFELSEVIYGCITLIQQAAVLVPWYVYRRQGDEIAELPSGPLVDFVRRPGPRMAWSRYIETYLGHLLLTGNTFQRFIVPSFKTRAAVQFLRPDRVTPKMGPLGTILYEYRPKGQMQTFLDDEVLHIKLYNPEEDEDNLKGVSPVAAIAKTVDVASYALEWMLRMLEKGAQPTVSLATEGNLTPEQKKDLKEQIKNDYQGPENAMNPLILEGGLRPFRLGFSPKDVEFDTTLISAMRRVCQVYKVPSELLGDPQTKTYSNVQEAEKRLYYKATLPHLNMLRDELNQWLVPMFDDSGQIFLDYDTSDLDALSEDMEKVWERAGKAVERGIIDRNEARDMMSYGKSTEPGADRLTVSASVVPLEAITGTGTEEE